MSHLRAALVIRSLALFLLLAALLLGPQLAAQQERPRQEITNSIEMKLAWIPPGTFVMGSPPGELQRLADERQFRVEITKGFYLGVHLVTQKQWQAVMGNNPSQTRGDDLPVEMVSWDECQDFVKKLSAKEGKRYRLPTEAEWEYACRAGTTTPFHFGDTISSDQANYHANGVYGKGVKGLFRAKTTAVDLFTANAWGLKDMHGNVYQWCEDWYGPYPQTESSAASRQTDYRNDKQAQARVARGGAWPADPVACRTANRCQFAPGHRCSYLGVRVCLSLER